MSHFYGDITGSARTSATRRGTKDSGMSAHIRSWHMGVKVEVENINGTDYITVWLTKGSKEPETATLLVGFVMPDDGSRPAHIEFNRS